MYLDSVGRVRAWGCEQLERHVYQDSMGRRHRATLAGRNAQTTSDAQLQNVTLLVANTLNSNCDNQLCSSNLIPPCHP